MPGKMNKNLADAYSKAKEIKRMERGNPRIANMSPGEKVKTLLRKKGERGSPQTVPDATKQKNDRAVQDFLEEKGIFNLPTVKPKQRKLPTMDSDAKDKETGGPKEDLEEVSAQLGKASKLHGNQSKRVASIAKGMKGEVGNPYMKRGKSKYGM